MCSVVLNVFKQNISVCLESHWGVSISGKSLYKYVEFGGTNVVYLLNKKTVLRKVIIYIRKCTTY